MELADFLAPLEGANPSGIDLRNEARFHAIERLLEPANREARAEAEKASGPGSVTLDWSEVVQAARDLAAEGRDLRLLVIVTRALLNEEGMPGLVAGLDLLRQTIATHWDTLHPALRPSPSPREAAIRRISALSQIQNADDGILCDLRFNVFLRPRGLGPITGADLAAGSINRATLISEGPQLMGPKEEADLVAAHEARVMRVATACRATAAEQPEVFADLLAATGAALVSLKALEDALNAHVADNGVGVRFAPVETLLARIAQTLKAAQAQTRTAEPQPAPAREAPMTAAEPPPIPAALAAGGNGAAIPGRLNSRAEVERCLDLIIDFYERTEPSSPIPHLARRVRKMVPMNFMQLMEEIAPSGMKEFRNAAGVLDEKTK
jgi:type VI secretion system protein ImpA